MPELFADKIIIMKRLTLLCWFFVVFQLSAQQQGPTKEDYLRAQLFLKEHFRQKVFNTYVTPHWLPDGEGMWFSLEGKGSVDYKRMDFSDMKMKAAFDHKKLSNTLNEEYNIGVRSDSLPLEQLKLFGKDSIQFRIGTEIYLVHLNDYSVTKRPVTPIEPRNSFQSFSPDGKWIAFAKDFNLYIRNRETGKEIQLSHSGQKHYEYGSHYGWGDIMEGENGDRPERFFARWSPDSKKILTNIVDTRVAEKMYLLDWSVDSLYRPRLLSYYRGSPGDSTMVYIKKVIFDIESQEEIPVELPPKEHIISPYLQWMPDSDRLVGSVYERGYKRRDYVEVEVKTGSVRIFYSESSETSVNNAFDIYQLFASQNKIIFSSERSGWNQLYMLDIATGEDIALTRGGYLVNDLVRVDEEEQVVYFTAMGKELDRNLYDQYLYQVDYNGENLTLLTPENAHHQITFSRDMTYFVDNYSTVQTPTRTVLRSTSDPTLKVELSVADASELFDLGWEVPETFKITAEDGISDIYCTLWKPTNFDPKKKYPIVEHSYTGPFTFRYPRSFGRALSGTNQALAELGFIVITIDGRGSAGRSKAFRDFSYKRLGYGLGDHVFAMKELAKRYSWFDVERVGIFGHSAGGYDAARGMLQYPEHYKVAVASSGDHDHRMEKAWWPEMYMGWPVDSAYHLQSNITMAKNLQGKLLLVHGGIDENVNPSATFKLSEALIKADKDFDLLIIPSQRHGYRGRYGDYFTKKRWNYFVEHLMGREPIWHFAE